MFSRLFIRILAIFCMIGFGILARRMGILSRDTTNRMAKAATSFFYPALIFTSLVSNFTLDGLLKNWGLPAGALLIMLTGYGIGIAFSIFVKFSGEQEKNQFVFQCAINNYSFLPLPIVLMLWGDAGVAGLIFSTLGSELAVWTIGVFALSGNRFRKENLRRLLSMPMIALMAAIVAVAVKDSLAPPAGLPFITEVWGSFFSMLDIFGKATIPVAMFVAGGRMAELKPHHVLTLKQGCVAGLRLVVIPGIAALFLYALPFSEETRLILLVLATMPSAISSVVLSEAYGSDTDFAASSVLTTQVLSLVTIPAWIALFLR